MGATSPLQQIAQLVKAKKPPIDVAGTPPIIDQNRTYDRSPTLQMPEDTGPADEQSAGEAGGILGAISQFGKDMAKPMEQWQTPNWMPNQGVVSKAQPTQTPPIFQAGSQLDGSALL